MYFCVHQFVGNNINVLPFRSNHDASAAADELSTAVGIEPKRAKSVRLIKEHKYGFRFNCAESAFDSRASISGDLRLPLLIGLQITSR